MEIHLNSAHESPQTLRALAAMLVTLAGGAGAISTADRPDAGADLTAVTKASLNRLQTLAGCTPPPDLAAAFGGAGNGAGSSATASSPPPALTGAGSLTPPIPTLAPAAASPAPDLAAAFGGNNAVPNGAPGAAALNAIPAPPANLQAPGALAVPNSGAATVGGVTQVETDADGLPWHDKIHSSNKKKGADGKWMRRRNVTDDTRRTIEAQLRAAVNVGNAPPPIGTAPPPPAIPTPPPSPPTTTAGGASNEALSFARLLPRVTSAVAAGQLTADTAAAIAMELSGGAINNVAMLAVAPQLIPAFWSRLDQLGVA